MGRPASPLPKSETEDWNEWEVYVSPRTIHDSRDFPAPTVEPVPEQVDLAAPLAVESSPLPLTETLTSVAVMDSITGDLAALTDSPTNLPSENALESPSSQLALDSIIEPVGDAPMPVSVEVVPKEMIQSQLARRLNVSDNCVKDNKRLGNDHFRVWSSENDPEGIGWEFDGRKCFTPILPDPNPDSIGLS